MKKTLKQRICELEKKHSGFPMLSPHWKAVGITIGLLAIVASVIFKFWMLDTNPLFKEIAKHSMLIGGFIYVLSRDKDEDERKSNLRFRAFAFAFLLGMLIIIMMPLAAMLFDTIQGRTPIVWEQDQSVFFFAFNFLMYQIMYFQIFKKQL